MRIAAAIVLSPLLILLGWALLIVIEVVYVGSFVVPAAKRGLYEVWDVKSEIEALRPGEKLPASVYYTRAGADLCISEQEFCPSYFDVDVYNYVDEVFWRITKNSEEVFVSVPLSCAQSKYCLNELAVKGVWPAEFVSTVVDPLKNVKREVNCIQENAGGYLREYCKRTASIEGKSLGISFSISSEAPRFFPFNSQKMSPRASLHIDFETNSIWFVDIPEQIDLIENFDNKEF